MLVNVCIVIIIVTYETQANHHKTYFCNVGTVLFSPKDLNRKQWTKAEISLLRARRHFQKVLPPPGIISTFNDNYINTLLNYFKNCYSHIKREATDPQTDSILTTALSDVLGGYLKESINPYAKVGYYAGLVSSESAIKLFLFYDELRSYLDTDGTGWHCTDELPVNMISNDIPTFDFKTNINPRSMRDTCDNLSFEKSDKGLSVPLPKIHWAKSASTMFVPMKNASLIIISLPDSKDTLIKYYGTAKNCIAMSSLDEAERFDNKFQTWLKTEVMPHLRDDNLYLALRNVLTMVNRTKGFSHTLYDMLASKTDKKCKVHRTRIDISSRKMTIIMIILLLEIAWCIPALFCILCTKKKKKNKSNSNVFLYIDQGKPDKKDKMNIYPKSRHFKIDTFEPKNDPPNLLASKVLKNSETQSTPPEHVTANTSAVRLTSPIKTAIKKSENFVGQYPSHEKVLVETGTGSRTYYKAKSRCSETSPKSLIKAPEMHEDSQTDIMDIQEDDRIYNRDSVEDIALMSSNSYLPRHTKPQTTRNPRRESQNLRFKDSEEPKKKAKSTRKHSPKRKGYKAVEQRGSMHNKMISTGVDNQSACRTVKIEEPTYGMSESEISNASLFEQMSCRNTAFGVPTMSESQILHVENPACPCINCVSSKNSLPKQVTKHGSDTKVLKELYGSRINAVMTVDTSNVDLEVKPTEEQAQEGTANYNTNMKSTITVEDPGKQFFKITVDRPATEIRLDINAKDKNNKDTKKKSKIPKRTAFPPPETTTSKVEQCLPEFTISSGATARSWIPKLKKKSADDSILSGNCTSSSDSLSHGPSTVVSAGVSRRDKHRD